jgi:hypothetical protein
LIYLGFITEGKLAAVLIKPSLGVSNWPVICIINYTPTKLLAPFNTAPSSEDVGPEVVDLSFFSNFVDGGRRVLAQDSTGTSPSRRATATCT